METRNRILKVIQDSTQRYDVMASSAGPSISMSVEWLKNATLNLSERGIHMRYLTDITKENLSYCKQLASIAEVRHIEGMKGGSALSEHEFITGAILRKKEPDSHLICSNVKTVIEHQNYIFEALWSKAQPAAQRFEQLESGKKPEFMTVIDDPKEVINIVLDLASSVEHEAFLILPNALMVSRQKLYGLLDLLVGAARDKKASIRIICPADSTNNEAATELRSAYESIQFREGIESNQMIFVVDNNIFLRAELNPKKGKSFEEAMGFAVHSNSYLTVSSFRSLFEMIWNHLQIIEGLRTLGRSREEFISVAAHELRSPITPIMVLAGLWKKGKARDDASIRMLIRSAEKLDTLVRDVLEVSRIENRSLRLEKTTLDLSQLIRDMISDTTDELEQDGKGDRLKLLFGNNDNIYSNHHVLVNADKGRIMEVLTNLLNNAIKFTRQGSVSVSVGEKENLAVIAVRDDGEGIDPDILPKLFTKFATKSHMGTGLGLFVSKNIVEAHGGKIWAENNSDGKGASFFFTLPLAELSAASAQ